MKLDFVEVAGFRGFKERTTFNFDSGFAVLTGRNGVGKSSVFDAIDFALTGTINKYRVTGGQRRWTGKSYLVGRWRISQRTVRSGRIRRREGLEVRSPAKPRSRS